MGNPHPTNGFDKRPHDINLIGGPKKEWTWTGLIKKALEQVEKDSGMQYKELVTNSLINKALSGDVVAIKEIGNRIEGIPNQQIDITSGGQSLIGLIKIGTAQPSDAIEAEIVEPKEIEE